MELNSTQQDTLRQFQEITNVQDREIALCTLASLDWNLEKAIETHLLNDTDGDDEQNAPPEAEPRVLPVREARHRIPMHVLEDDEDMEDDSYYDMSHGNEEDEDDIPVELRRQQLPSSSSSNHRGGVFGADSEEDVDFDDDEATSRADAAPKLRTRSTNDIPLIPQDSDSIIESLQNFITVFESRYCPNNGAFMPNFHVDTLNNTIRESFDALGRDVSERRPLAIYIHNDKSVAANIFASNVMCKPEVSDLLRKQFVLWGWDVTFKENLKKLVDWVRTLNIGDPRQLYEQLHFQRDKYPLLVLLTKEKGTLKIISICDGTYPADAVISQLVVCVDEFASIRMNEIQEKNAREERERIRQEQAKEYEESLAADRARREAIEKEIREQKEEKERQIRAEEEEKMRRARLESELPDEPAENAPDAILIKFRLPEGDQLMRRFRNSERLGIMNTFLSSKGYGTEQYRYFNADFPKKEVSNWDANSSFSALKWPKREQIFVEEQ